MVDAVSKNRRLMVDAPAGRSWTWWTHMDTLEKLKKQFPYNGSETAPAPDPVKDRSGLIEYDKEVQAPPADPAAASPPNTWKESQPIKELSDHLKKCEGIKLVQIDGKPALHFIAGITSQNINRWSQAMTALDLLSVAIEDIKHLMKLKRIKLPRRPEY